MLFHNRGRLVVVSGPSGAGKTTIVRGLRERTGMVFSVSATTRLPRPGEIDGVDYQFLDRDEFLEKVENGEFLEWAEYGSNLYGTLKSEVDEGIRNGETVLLEIEIKGARQIRALRPDALMVFVMPPSMDVLEERLRGRGDTADDQIRARLQIAKEEIDEAPNVFDLMVVNDVVDEAVDEIVEALESEESDEVDDW